VVVQNQTGLAPVARSSFVTVVAWIFIVLAGLTTFISLLQNVMIGFMLPLDDVHLRTGMREMPPFFVFLLNHVRWFFLGFLLVSATTLASAIGLLLRRNWARLVFIAILALGIVWNIGGIALQQMMLSSMQMPMPPNAPQDFADGFNVMSKVIVVFGALMAIGFSVLYGWIIRKLVSPAIRAEFAALR
jgi:hypothetical protein